MELFRNGNAGTMHAISANASNLIQRDVTATSSSFARPLYFLFFPSEPRYSCWLDEHCTGSTLVCCSSIAQPPPKEPFFPPSRTLPSTTDKVNSPISAVAIDAAATGIQKPKSPSFLAPPPSFTPFHHQSLVRLAANREPRAAKNAPKPPPPSQYCTVTSRDQAVSLSLPCRSATEHGDLYCTCFQFPAWK